MTAAVRRRRRDALRGARQRSPRCPCWWSVAPELAYVETGRTFAYLATFAAGVAADADLAQRGGRRPEEGVVLAAMAAIRHTHSPRGWPGASPRRSLLSNRLAQPFPVLERGRDEPRFPAVSPLCLKTAPSTPCYGRDLGDERRSWRSSQRARRSPRPRSARWPGSCWSRCGCGACRWCWRRRPGARECAWALSKDAFSRRCADLEEKESVAGEFGLLLLLLAVGLLAVGLAVNVGAFSRRLPGFAGAPGSPRWRSPARCRSSPSPRSR